MLYEVDYEYFRIKRYLVTKTEEMANKYALFIERIKRSPICPARQSITLKAHDDRIQKMNHLKWFERLTVL
ncbi:hypothetical protein KSI01_14490 [Kurthia sibirica]|uniref:Uncharacterized protein n=1 Tax=Kurthia sibirica TaxID=202750 RepID=A0A2U3AM00_9BACL|nr:hypothetical protein DEX24_07995 [Kurthia sibirica]GEK33916.1 hypothetical protein KSI01_14490 [Kurthia sibirica]